MAKPAEKALNTILAKHPSAQLDLRRERSLQADLGDGGKALVASIGAMHYREPGVEGWLPIDTTWNPTTGAWQYEMTTAPYQAYARDNFNVGTLVEYQAKSGEFVTFQPLAVSWRDENDSQEQIATPQSVATVVTDDVLSWPNGYGPGRSMEWRAHPTRLQKILRVETVADLPTPAAYLTGSIELELAFAFTFDASVTAFVDGVAWDRSTKRTTGSAIEFRNASGDVLWHFTTPKAWDSDGNETTGVLVVYKVGNTLHVATRFPRAFVDASVFPLYVDPTVTVSVAAGNADGHLRYNDATTYTIGTTWTDFRVGGTSTARYQAWTGFAAAVPQGATITDATVTYVQALAVTGTVADLDDFTITAEDVDDAAPVGGGRTSSQLWGTAHTTASVAWALNTTGAAGDSRVTPAITSVVQEVVDRAGWVSGNNLNIRVTHPTIPAADTYYSIASYENTTYDPPSLYVEYNEGTTVDASVGAATASGFTSTTTTTAYETVALTPNQDVARDGIVTQDDGTTNLFASVDDVWGASDDDVTYLKNATSAGGSATFGLSDLHGNMSAPAVVRLRVRAKVVS